MIRRSLLKISSRGLVRRIPTQITSQIPIYLSSRKEFSVASPPNTSKGSGSTSKLSDSGSVTSKVVIGTVTLGAAFLAAYQTGYLDRLFNNKETKNVGLDMIPASNKDSDDLLKVNQESQDHLSSFQESSPHVENGDKVIETQMNLSETNGEIDSQEKDMFVSKPQDDVIPSQESELLETCQSEMTSDNVDSKNSESSLEIGEKLEIKSKEMNPAGEQVGASESTPIVLHDAAVVRENEMKVETPGNFDTKDSLEGVLNKVVEKPSFLLDEYYLRHKTEETMDSSSNEQEDLVQAVKDLNDVHISKDGKLVLDFLEAIHAAEKRQAELDAQTFFDEKRKLKEKYEKELKDARARELMYAEREAILDKELIKEKTKAAAALNVLQQKLEAKHRMELEQKESEAELGLQKLRDLAKAELAATIASEKASQIEKMAEADLNINALCMAFYARSEEARQIHSVHKIALGALALEDALSKGLPIQKELDALHTYLEGNNADSLLDLVMSSLPEETLKNGTDTTLQLIQKFDDLKGTLRHYSLIPPGGGGILAHSLAQLASLLKVREADKSGDGIESLINRVESFLAEGKLKEASDTLEEGLKGTGAGGVIADWVKRARNRAISEQALTLLQSYAISVGFASMS